MPAVAQDLTPDGSPPEILPRAAWGARPANYALMQEQKPAEIIIHHTGTRQQPQLAIEVKMRGLQDFSMAPGRVGILPKAAWGDVPYHFYIDVSGRIAEGRDIAFAGDGVTAFDNDGRIQIAVEGDFEQEQPTKGQLAALMKLVAWLSLAYGIAPEALAGHGDFDQTNCPGKALKPYIAQMRETIRALTDGR